MMIASLAMGLALAQTVEMGPVSPAGSSLAFQRTVTEICEALEASKFDVAARLAARMPTRKISIGWDDSQVPVGQRRIYRRALDNSIAAWRQLNAAYEFTVAKKGNLMISFTEKLPTSETSGLPLGAAFIPSNDPADPPLEVVIALKRMVPSVTVEAPTIEMECAYAIGAYLGLAEQPKMGTAMGRSDGLTQLRAIIAPFEMQIAELNVEIGERLRKAAAAKKRLVPARPELFVNPSQLTFDQATQGKVIETSFQVENRGNVAMSFSVVPDCNCFTLSYKSILEPGSTGLVRVFIDTTEFPGPFNKALHVFSGDPEVPQRRILVNGTVEPLYRIIPEERTGTIQMTDTGATGVFYLLTSKSAPIKVDKVTVNGVNAIADVEPFKGAMADPEMKDPAREREGYKITLLMSPSQIRGRVMGTMRIQTDNGTFANILYSFYVQRGIAANPSTLFLGDIAQEPYRAWVLLSRPGRPYKILSVSSTNPQFKASFEALPTAGDYKLIVEYSGKGDLGPISGVVTVTTDDPAQPKIEVPVQGNVT